MPVEGLEPLTLGLWVKCSATLLPVTAQKYCILYFSNIFLLLAIGQSLNPWSLDYELSVLPLCYWDKAKIIFSLEPYFCKLYSNPRT